MSSPTVGRDPTATRDSLAALAATKQHVEGECPDPGELVAWREQSLTSDRTSYVEDHVAHCARCFESWVELCEALPAPASSAAVPWWRRLVAKGPPQRGWRWQPAVVAAGMAVLGLSAVLNINPVAQLPLASYELSLEGSADWRGPVVPERSDAVLVLTEGNRFELMLRPQTTLAETPQVRLYVVDSGSPRQLVTPSATALGEGTVAVRGVIGDSLPIPRASDELWVVIGRAGRLPTVDLLGRQLADNGFHSAKHWQAWRLRIRHED